MSSPRIETVCGVPPDFMRFVGVCEGCTDIDCCSHPSRTSVSEKTVKLSTEGGEEASRQSDQGEVEGGQI